MRLGLQAVERLDELPGPGLEARQLGVPLLLEEGEGGLAFQLGLGLGLGRGGRMARLPAGGAP